MINKKLKENRFHIGLYISIIVGSLIIGGFVFFGITQINKNGDPVASNNNKTSNLNKIDFAQCINFRDARDYLGQERCVYGKIYNIHITAKGMIFINFCKDYRVCPFYVVVFDSDANKFSNIVSDTERYEGKNIKISGEITTFRGRTQIILRNPEQLKTYGF